MKKMKYIMTASILIVGIIIGVVYASVQDNADSTGIKSEDKLFIRSGIPDDELMIIVGDDFLRNWSITMPNNSIDLRKHNDTHDSFSMVYNDAELFSFIVDKNTSMDIRDMLSSLIYMIQYDSNYNEPQEILISNNEEFHYTEGGLIYYDELLGIWCMPV